MKSEYVLLAEKYQKDVEFLQQQCEHGYWRWTTAYNYGDMSLSGVDNKLCHNCHKVLASRHVHDKSVVDLQLGAVIGEVKPIDYDLHDSLEQKI